MSSDKPKKGKVIRKPRHQITIEDDVHPLLKAKAKERHVTMQEFVNESVLLIIERDKFLKQYGPNFKYSVTEQGIFIEDARQKTSDKPKPSAQVVMQNGKLVCYLDESNDCEHVHFAAAIPEVVKLGLNRSSKV